MIKRNFLRHLIFDLKFINAGVLETPSGFACAFCGRPFASNRLSNCRRHVREMHLGLGQTSCPFCGVTLTRNEKTKHVAACRGAPTV